MYRTISATRLHFPHSISPRRSAASTLPGSELPSPLVPRPPPPGWAGLGRPESGPPSRGGGGSGPRSRGVCGGGPGQASRGSLGRELAHTPGRGEDAAPGIAATAGANIGSARAHPADRKCLSGPRTREREEEGKVFHRTQSRLETQLVFLVRGLEKSAGLALRRARPDCLRLFISKKLKLGSRPSLTDFWYKNHKLL